MKYPRLGDYRKPRSNSSRRCLLCGSSPAGIQHIEVNEFRGDDDGFPACQNCVRQRKPEILAAYKASVEGQS